ncbi:MAG TPA: amidohydrolase family protein [Rhodanobacteraceae bacterium]
MRVDAHAHFWQLGDHGCTWPPPELNPIYRDFLPANWRVEADRAGIDCAIAVQSQACAADTDWLLQLAAHEPRIGAVVGWVDLAAPDAPARIAALAAHPKLRGLRPMLQDLPADDWILSPSLAPALAAMERHGLRFDALVRPPHLPFLLRFAERRPELPIIIDHAAKPAIARHELEPWRTWITRLAALPRVCCKLSGLVTEAGEHWARDDLVPYVGHLFTAFGSQRLLWGSDWPVVNLACNHARWFALAGELVGDDDKVRAAVFGGNAARVYGLQT